MTGVPHYIAWYLVAAVYSVALFYIGGKSLSAGELLWGIPLVVLGATVTVVLVRNLVVIGSSLRALDEGET